MTVADQLIEKGIIKGSLRTKKEIARKMLEKNIEIELIIELTDLTTKEIEKIKQSK